jgi:hypothetical protein
VLEYCAPACLACRELEEQFGSEDDDVEGDYDPPESSVDKGESVPIPWGLPQVLGADFPEKVLDLMDETATYMKDIVYVDKEYNHVFEECENRSEECSLWAVSGMISIRICSCPPVKK